MRFARWVFLISGVYGVLILAPPLIAEPLMNKFYPPPINHPEWYYGFFGAALAWQGAFLVVAYDPVRFRPLMLVGIAEKLLFSSACLLLLLEHRLARQPAELGLLDAVWMALFGAAYFRTPKRLPAS
jgi:hypothetical protein